ncbi:MAG: TIGR00282 family metallophosphoesterase [Candidatus Portnoybacteria bacterium CG_4_8_14_3_um_filter_44_15]|uniref:TIGR00282 family metallophosphoesterase n=4 Tax=Candidatus Portnoyibacteriota TaxID=1817913 RepID=A0A2M7YL73_9BACT|nr:MAG: metallophosphoesterase [Parcubacteria group bacterium CG1_02_44_65]PIP15668.1 MAG: TIGR00282 family metallophosphoesterase [Candidatus Portnoybacteria bacterium CG23_combo_of_CG06-09_8_20_14_all_44_36]PIW74867.1 MAG: TIGR00282 family metallophosphoesterase [Candidatus Portnoybacteria bacterium CG_4_8_14_3_um_filter_44_15]PIZ69418.1 MAG: TIGR00282 family metallophosphoesterase [Candidatus Portnoybacteria bacterium CG_4_10_14_0_2_um_filter_43_36]PJA63734.1 MAG: TIGR00282 family metallopho
MKIIFFGDIVGQPGREAIKKIVPRWQKRYQPDLLVANGENIAHGSGITEKTLQELLSAGVDIITSGDHILKQINSQKKPFAFLKDKKMPIIRPANCPTKMPGRGYLLKEVGTKKVLIINLIGLDFISHNENCSNPFKKIDRILSKKGKEVDIILIDFHAETTAEKVCLGWYLDGRVSAVLGTHTHVPTADERILPQKTAYITDVGMVGVRDSSLGRDKEAAVKRFLTGIDSHLDVPEGPVEVNAVLLKISRDGRAKKIQRLQEIVN